MNESEELVPAFNPRMYYSYQTRRRSKAFLRAEPRAPPRGRPAEGFSEARRAEENPEAGRPRGGAQAWPKEKPYFANSFDKNNILYNLPILRRAQNTTLEIHSLPS